MNDREMTKEEKDAWEKFKRDTSCIHPSILEEIEKNRNKDESKDE